MQLLNDGKVTGYGRDVESISESQDAVTAGQTHGQGITKEAADYLVDWPVLATVNHFSSFAHYYS